MCDARLLSSLCVKKKILHVIANVSNVELQWVRVSSMCIVSVRMCCEGNEFSKHLRSNMYKYSVRVLGNVITKGGRYFDNLLIKIPV